MTTHCYRLNRSDALPSHWSYETADADEANEGFQAWINVADAVRAAAGENMDGEYAAADYPLLLVVDAVDVSDGGSFWWAVLPGDVERVRAVATADLLTWIGESVDTDDRRALRRWLAVNADDVDAWLDANARDVAIAHEETL